MEAMKIQNGSPSAKCEVLFYNEEIIEFANQFEYLGKVLTPQLSFSGHLKMLRRKSANASNIIFSNLDLSTIFYFSAKELVKSVVYPAGKNRSEIFSHTSIYYKKLSTEHVQHMT